MKIESLSVLHLDPRFSVLRIDTDSGLYGLGEACLEGKARVVEQALVELSEQLVGQDPLAGEKIFYELHRGLFYPPGSILASALSAIDQALWDIKGKHFGVPVHVLLGGPVRERVRAYTHVNVGDWSHDPLADREGHLEALVAAAKQAVASGFTMIKTALPGPAKGLENPAYVEFQARRFAALREAVGDDVDIAIDFHGRVRPALARVLIKAIEPYRPMFVEEPCLPENPAEMARLAAAVDVPIATGERLFTRWGFREVLESGAASVLQPDLGHCGGISEGFKIAAMADVYYALMAPHNPLGPVNLAASLQLAAAIPNFLCQEQSTLGEGVITAPFEQRGGYLELPTAPGLGVELIDGLAERSSYDGRGPLMVWRDRDDGGLVPW